MNFKVALNAVLSFFENLPEEFIEGNPIAFLIAVLLLVGIFVLLWKGLKKKVLWISHESAEEAVQGTMESSFQGLKEEIDKKLISIHHDVGEDIRSSLLNLQRKELEACGKALIEEMKQNQETAEPLPEPEPVKPADKKPVEEEKVKLTDLDKHLMLATIKRNDVSPRTEFYIKQEMLGRDIICSDHSFMTRWSNLFKDLKKETEAYILFKEPLERYLFSLACVCPECGKVWSYTDISNLDLPKVHDEDEEETSRERVAESAEQPIKEPILLPPSTLPAISLGVPADDCPDEEVMQKKDEGDDEAEDVNEVEAESQIPLPTIFPSAISRFVWSKDDELSKDIEEALKEEKEAPAPTEDAEQPTAEVVTAKLVKEPEQKKEELTDTQAIPVVADPLLEPKPYFSSRPVITYPGSEKKEKRGFLFRISFKKHKDLSGEISPEIPQEKSEGEQEREQRRRWEARVKWEQKRERSKEKLAEAIKKRKGADAKRLRKGLV